MSLGANLDRGQVIEHWLLNLAVSFPRWTVRP
jgi:hypothetical protein